MALEGMTKFLSNIGDELIRGWLANFFAFVTWQSCHSCTSYEIRNESWILIRTGNDWLNIGKILVKYWYNKRIG